MRRLCIAALALGLTACAGQSATDYLFMARAAILGTVEAVAVKGILTAEQAGAIAFPDAEAGDKILDQTWTQKAREVELPDFLDGLRDKAIDGIASLCVRGYLSQQDADAIGFGAVGDPVWAKNCSDLIRLGEPT